MRSHRQSGGGAARRFPEQSAAPLAAMGRDRIRKRACLTAAKDRGPIE
jgi:hypothetical protein